MVRHTLRRSFYPWLVFIGGLFLIGCNGDGDVTRIADDTDSVGADQAFQRMEACQPCHERQFQETLQSVKSGYRSASPLFNGLEIASNFLLTIGFLQDPVINLRPLYQDPTFSDLPSGRNLVSAEGGYQNQNEIRSGLCIGCHDGAHLLRGEDVAEREIPEWTGRLVSRMPGSGECGGANQPPCCQHADLPCLPAIVDGRPLRDYHFVNADNVQILPEVPGGPPPPGALPSLGAQGISCDHCHNVQGPDTERTTRLDGYANMGHKLEFTNIKVGPFDDPVIIGPLPEVDNPLVPPSDLAHFHAASGNASKIGYIRSADFCNACHDVRLPITDLLAPEQNALGTNYFRLENLSTEWATQAYALPDRNPFNQVVRCQDCHFSKFPFGGDTTYTVHDEETGRDFTITSPLPGCRNDETPDGAPCRSVFPVNKTASGTDPTGTGLPVSELPDRPVVTHYATGIDAPLLYTDCDAARAFGRTDECAGEMRERLGPTRVDVFDPRIDEHGLPVSLESRRRELAKAASRIFLDLTDEEAELGETFHARVTAVGLAGHNFPAGFSQERTAFVELTVSAALASGSSICSDMSYARARGVCVDDTNKSCLTDADCGGSACGGRCASAPPDQPIAQRIAACTSDSDCPGENNFCQRAQSQFCTRDGQFILYQSGYLIDKPHPETGEMEPDGNLDDEDNEHVNAIVNPFTHDNEIFEEGIDNGPVARIFEGEPRGLVLFRNELLRLYGPEYVLEPEEPDGCESFFEPQCAIDAASGEVVRIGTDESSCVQTVSGGDGCPEKEEIHCVARGTGILAGRDPGLPVVVLTRHHPRTGECLAHVLEEETFSAGISTTVDNWRSLPPLDPKTFLYEIELPSQEELEEYGVELAGGPLRVQAAMQFQHFPPLFLRFLARATGAVEHQTPPYGIPGFVIPVEQEAPLIGHENEVGLRGPSGRDIKLVDEKRLDDLMKNMRDVSVAEPRTVPLKSGDS